jgi:hypothetical protein
LFVCLSKKKNTHTQGIKKNNEEKQMKKHKWKGAVCDHVKKKKRRQENSSEVESFKHMKIKYRTHLKMAT